MKRFLPPGDPIGRRVTLGEGDEGEPWMTIVGVVADVRHASLDTAPEPALFTPYGQRPSPSMTLVVGADAAPLSLTEPIRRIVSRLDPDRPVFAVRTMEQVMARSVWQSRFFTWLVALFGGVALVLASVGVYSVISCSVARRSAEIGVRLALGARRWHIRWLVMRHGLLPTLLGLAAGLARRGARRTGARGVAARREPDRPGHLRGRLARARPVGRRRLRRALGSRGTPGPDDDASGAVVAW